MERKCALEQAQRERLRRENNFEGFRERESYRERASENERVALKSLNESERAL
jgi:hypothetical protein